MPQFVGDLRDLITAKLDELLALLAVHVVVLRIAVVVLVDGASAQSHAAQQARVDHFR